MKLQICCASASESDDWVRNDWRRESVARVVIRDSVYVSESVDEDAELGKVELEEVLVVFVMTV